MRSILLLQPEEVVDDFAAYLQRLPTLGNLVTKYNQINNLNLSLQNSDVKYNQVKTRITDE